MFTAVLCKITDLQDGQMKNFEVEKDMTVLLVKEGGQFHALAGKCVHYGAKLADGVLHDGCVRCPWHGARYNIHTGDIEDFPGLDCLPKFQTSIEGDSVVLTADRTALKDGKRVKDMCKLDENKKENPVIIIGGGSSGTTCAEALRQEGYTGRIMMLTQENDLPYDRVKLSKAPGTDVEKILLRAAEFYDKYNISVQKNAKVTSVSVGDQAVSLADGDTIHYSSLLLATGGAPRRLTCPGADLQGVQYLRTPEDSRRLAELVKDKNVVIIGSSFIGMEVAASLVEKAKSMTSVDMVKEPFINILGEKVGGALRKMFEAKGVQFKRESGVESLIGVDGHVTHVVIKDGTQLPADVVIAGIGVAPATDFLKGSGIKMDDKGFIPVDEHLRTSDPHVYATGDICTFPLRCFDLPNINVQHWQISHKHGSVAGAAIAGKPRPLETVPFFWTSAFGKSVRYCGYGAGFDDTVIHGDLENVNELKFVAYYIKAGKVVAVASLGRDPVCSMIAEIFRYKKTITKDDVMTNPTDDWKPWLQ